MVLSALGIIMVVDAHCWGSLQLFTTYFPYNSFFMPMFVFISGYFNKVDKDTRFGKYIIRKSKTLLLPYFCISLVAMFIEWLIECYREGVVTLYSPHRFISSLTKAFTSGEIEEIVSPLWFVPTLFAVQVVYAIIKKTLYTRWNSKFVFLFMCIMNILVVNSAKRGGVMKYNMLMLKVVFFIPFIELGILYRDVLEEKLKKANHLLLLLTLMLINMARIMIMPDSYDIAFNELSTLSGFSSPYFVTPLISSVAGIFFWLEMTEIFAFPLYDDRIVNYISENTFFIMGFHIIFFNFLNFLLLFINNFIPLPEFSEISVLNNCWYRWEYFPQFRLAYFTVGVIGPLSLKQIHDRLRKKVGTHHKLFL